MSNLYEDTELGENVDLSNPETQELLKTYRQESLPKMRKELYDPLVEEYPSLEPVVEDFLSENYNPAGDLDNLYERLQQLETVGNLLSNLSDMMGMITGEDGQEVQQFAEAADAIQETFENVSEIMPQFEKHYRAKVAATREVAEEEGIKPEEVPKTQERRDKVFKRLHPTREEAEEYALISVERYGSMLKPFARIQEIGDKQGLGSQLDTDSEEIPRIEALEAVEDHLLDHYEEEINRIYRDQEQ
ncbi:MAG: hypothetical protein SVV03_02065 [Candidatus Nanohaloarchaea archaeon]|nr:hypothetical protein [Candidatus Nanohaloarchaea archaeon]